MMAYVCKFCIRDCKNDYNLSMHQMQNSECNPFISSNTTPSLLQTSLSAYSKNKKLRLDETPVSNNTHSSTTAIEKQIPVENADDHGSSKVTQSEPMEPVLNQQVATFSSIKGGAVDRKNYIKSYIDLLIAKEPVDLTSLSSDAITDMPTEELVDVERCSPEEQPILESQVGPGFSTSFQPVQYCVGYTLPEDLFSRYSLTSLPPNVVVVDRSLHSRKCFSQNRLKLAEQGATINPCCEETFQSREFVEWKSRGEDDNLYKTEIDDDQLSHYQLCQRLAFYSDKSAETQ